MPILAVGSLAFDTIRTPHGAVEKELGGSCTYFSLAASYFTEVRVIGEYAFDRGSFAFSVAPRSGGDTSRETGKYLFLYSRAADGSWKIARAIVNLDAHESEEA